MLLYQAVETGKRLFVILAGVGIVSIQKPEVEQCQICTGIPFRFRQELLILSNGSVKVPVFNTGLYRLQMIPALLPRLLPV